MNRIIEEACNRSERFEKTITPDTLVDLRDSENAKNILANCYVLGYIDAKSRSGKWNNPIPTWDDTKYILTSIYKWLCNIPPYIISRCHKIGNRKIIVFIKQDIEYMKKTMFANSNCKISRNGWKLSLAWMLEDKYVKRGLIKKFNIFNNDPDHYKCIWVNEKGLNGYVEVHLRNCNQVVNIEYSI